MQHFLCEKLKSCRFQLKFSANQRFAKEKIRWKSILKLWKMLQIQAKFQLLKKMQVKIVLIFEKKLKREK